MSGEKIKISRINGKTLLFNVEHYMKIRTEHRIVGKLIGIPASQQRNPACKGLPCFYNEYETKLLLEEGIAVLETRNDIKNPPNEKTKEDYKNQLKTVEEEIQKPYLESRLKQTEVNMERIIQGKTKKLLKSGVLDNEITAEEILKEEEARLRESFSSKNTYIHIPMQHPFSLSFNLITEFSVKNIQKYKVFRDLWKKGFYISTGDSFGCDFMTYAADPMHFHASQLVHVVDENKSHDVKYLISCSRLSVSVNKKCLFAYVNEHDTITYQTSSWDNPKLRDLYPQEGSEQNREVFDESVQIASDGDES